MEKHNITIQGSIPSSKEIFDLHQMPIKILDRGWQRYHPYLFTIDHRNPLANRVVEKDYIKQTRLIEKAIIKTFPIDQAQFVIRESAYGLFVDILMAMTDDNVDVIEQIMENKGFLRSQQANERLLYDRRNRPWIDVRFELKNPDDVTEEVHRKYDVLLYLTPSTLEQSILQNGLIVSNNNPDYRDSGSKAFLRESEYSTKEIHQLVNKLFVQAQGKCIPNITPKYTIFTFDLNKMKNDIRFFYDMNEPMGLYTKVAIPPRCILNVQHITIEIDKLP